MSDAKKVLVVGGGIAGMTAAWELSNLGVDVLLVEKTAFLGGRSAQFACKATDHCLKCNNCLVEERLAQVNGAQGIETMLQTGIEAVERQNGGYSVKLSTAPLYIDPGKCTNCGVCFDKCPAVAEGAILQGPSYKTHPFFAINTESCHYFQDGKARICQDACPEDAIDLARNGSEKTVEVDGIVLATGYIPFDPRQKTRFNFDGYPNMITGLDLERMLRDKGGVFRPSDGKPAQTVAFVQCVGSRDVSLGHDYCSRVCCGYALRMGMRIGHDDKNANVSVFYMDIQNFGKDFDRYMKEAKGSVRLVRSMPGDYYAAPDDRISVRYYDQEQRTVINEEFDLVVLSVGISPNPENESLSGMLGLSLNQFGFLNSPENEAAKGTESPEKGAKSPTEGVEIGVTVAGTAEGPMDVAESITHAARAAEQMARCLGVIQ